jgi:hypothetical protein
VTRRLVLVAALAAGCGRFQFDRVPVDASIDSTIDASIVPAPTHRYTLTAGLADELGGPALVSLGGAVGATGFKFEANKGLQLTDALTVSAYTIDLEFAFDQIAGYRKIVDFKALSTDEGLYVDDETLDFVTRADTQTEIKSLPMFTAGTLAQLTLTRGADGAVVGYLARAPVIRFADTGAVAVFSFAGRVANFAVDDLKTSQLEAASGVVRRITIWDQALTAEQVAALP